MERKINKLTRELISPFLFEIVRKDMPQVSEKDIEEMIAIFEDNGIGYKAGPVTISRLHPTQEDFKPDKVKEMVANLKTNKMVLFPIVVSEDGYIMDGHHRWLAAKELYGENSEIPAIIIALPKDEALLMFTKTSDKIEETITETPDVIYDKEGNELMAHNDALTIAFGYDLEGDMIVGGPNVYHQYISGWYDEFDPDAAQFIPGDRREMEFPGRIWVDEKIISFWEYPEPGDLPRILKDIEGELQRIHDEFPEFAEEHEVPLVKFDDEWTIDLYYEADRAEADRAEFGTDKTHPADKIDKSDTKSDPTDDLDTDDQEEMDKIMRGMSDLERQRSLGLTKNIVNRDVSDRIAGRGKYRLGPPGTYDPDDDDDFDDETEEKEDPELIKTGTQVPISQYTGLTDKEKEFASAQSKIIQHVLPPLHPDKKKKTVHTGWGSRYELHPKMSHAQYKQFICTSEGKRKTLADFLVDSILTETPDTVLDKGGSIIADYDKGGIAFGYYEGKMYIGTTNATHPSVANIYKAIDDDRKWDFQETWPKSRRDFKYSGRYWPEQKLISFWDYPVGANIDTIFRDIEEEAPRFQKMVEKYLKTASDEDEKHFIGHYSTYFEPEPIKFDDQWTIDVADASADNEGGDYFGNQISVGDYKDDSKKAEWSPEIQAKQHTMSPADPRKIKRNVPIKLKRSGMNATEYHQFICTSEGKKMPGSLLTEDPDTVYDSEGEMQVEYADDMDEFPFGYVHSADWIRDRFGYSYKQMNKRIEDADKMRIGEIGTTHGDISMLYSRYEEYAGMDRQDFKYGGRVFLSEKIISFWEYPEPEELQKVLRDIEKEIERIKDLGKEDELEIADIKFDDSWTIDLPGKYTETGIQKPITDYTTGRTEKEKATAVAQSQAIQHALSPADPRKIKRYIPEPVTRAGMNATEYHQYVCTSEGKRKTLSDFLVEPILTETPEDRREVNPLRYGEKYFKPDEVTSLKKSAQKFQNAEDFINSRFENEVFYINGIEIFKNPTHNDYRSIGDDFRKKYSSDHYYANDPKSRSLRDSNGNRYIWRSWEAMHSLIEPGIQKKFNVKTDQSTFSGDRFDRDTHEKELRKVFDTRSEIPEPEKTELPTDLPGEPEKEKSILSKRKMNATEYHQYVCTSEGKTLFTEHPDTVFDSDGKEIANWNEDDAYPFGYNKKETMYLGVRGSAHDAIPNFYYRFDKDTYKSVPRQRPEYKFPGRIWVDKKVISFWIYPEPEELQKVIKDIENEFQRINDKYPQVAFDYKIPRINIDADWKIDVYKKEDRANQAAKPVEPADASDASDKSDLDVKFKPGRDTSDLDVKYNPGWSTPANQFSSMPLARGDSDADDSEDDYGYSKEKTGDQISLSHYSGQTEKEKARAKAQAQAIQHALSPADPKKIKRYAPTKLKRADMNATEYHQYVCTSEGISDKLNEDSDTSVIKKKINNVEFEFKYNYHVIEPYFTVSRDGVVVDRMSATLSKEEMSEFIRQNYAQWQADYVKSFGSFVTQIPQQGTTQGMYGENKKKLIDISVFLD